MNSLHVGNVCTGVWVSGLSQSGLLLLGPVARDRFFSTTTNLPPPFDPEPLPTLCPHTLVFNNFLIIYPP